MPLTKDSDDYLDLVQQDILDRYHISLPKATIKEILDQFQASIRSHIRQASMIDLAPFLTIHPSLPLIRSLRTKYYSVQTATSPTVKHILKTARQSSKQDPGKRQATPSQTRGKTNP